MFTEFPQAPPGQGGDDIGEGATDVNANAGYRSPPIRRPSALTAPSAMSTEP